MDQSTTIIRLGNWSFRDFGLKSLGLTFLPHPVIVRINLSRVAGAIPCIIISMISTTTKKAGFFFLIFFIQFPVPITPGGVTALISTNSVILLDMCASKASHESILGYKTLFHF